MQLSETLVTGHVRFQHHLNIILYMIIQLKRAFQNTVPFLQDVVTDGRMPGYFTFPSSFRAGTESSTRKVPVKGGLHPTSTETSYVTSSN